MLEYIEFILNHWALSGAFIFVLIFFCLNEFKQQSFGIPKLSIAEMIQLINREEAVVVDIREKPLYESGHLVNAVNLPLKNLEKEFGLLKKYQSKPLVVMCLNGLQSTKAALKLKGLGFNHISCLEGGMHAWKSENLPLVK